MSIRSRGFLKQALSPLGLFLSLALIVAACGGNGAESTTTTAAPEATTTAAGSDETTTTEGTVDLPTVRYTQAGTSLSFANLLYAQSVGYFEDEGLTMEYLAFPPSSADVVTLLTSDQADVAFAAPSAFYAAVNQGRPLLNYATAQKGPTLGVTISNKLKDELEAAGITEDSPIAERVAALEGRTIAGVGAGSATHAMMMMALEEAGLNPETDVTYLPVPDHTEASNAVREDVADAYVAALPALLTGGLDGWGTLWFAFVEVPAIGDMPWIEFTARTDFAEEHPEAIRAILRALWRVSEDFEQNPDEVARVLKENWYPDMDQALFDASFQMSIPTFSNGILPTEDGLARSLAVVNATAEIPIELTFDQVYDLSHVEATQP